MGEARYGYPLGRNHDGRPRVHDDREGVATMTTLCPGVPGERDAGASLQAAIGYPSHRNAAQMIAAQSVIPAGVITSKPCQ